MSYPKKSENVRPILVTVLKMQPHSSQSSGENAAPSSGTRKYLPCGVDPSSVWLEKFRHMFGKQNTKSMCTSWSSFP